MAGIVFGCFSILHGFVHLLYFGHSAGYYELQPGLAWPDGSWALRPPVSQWGLRRAASILLVIAAVGLVLGGLGILFQQIWWRPVIMGSAAFSSVLFLILWDGPPDRLADKGGVGLVINIVILLALLVFQRPGLESRMIVR